MSAALTLVSHALCPYVQRAAIVLSEKGVPFERVTIDLADKPDWFRALSPLGKVPLLRVPAPAGGDGDADGDADGDGAVLFESAVILEYLEETRAPALHPPDPLDRARHRGWIAYGSALLDAIARFYNAPDAAAFEAARADLAARFARLETAVAPAPYFDGAAFRVIDAVYAPVFRYLDAFERIDDFRLLAGTPGLRRWRAALAERPSVAGAVAPDYPDRLMAFLARRGGALADRIAARGLAVEA